MSEVEQHAATPAEREQQAATAANLDPATSAVSPVVAPLVTPEPTIFIKSGTLSADEARTYPVPTLCGGSGCFCGMCWAWCLITLFVPLGVLLVFVLELEHIALLVLAIALPVLGCVYLCCFSSLRTLLRDGVIFKPKPPEKICAFKCDANKEVVKTITVIVNPKSGHGRAMNDLKICRKVWEASGLEVTVVETTHAGHSLELGRTLPLDGVDALCIIGGDGSFHELVNGLLSRADGKLVPLGLIPGGSGNSLACDLGTWDVAKAAQRVADGNVCLMDVNLVSTLGETVASINTLCFGLVGDIAVAAEKLACLGGARYDATAGWGLLKGFKKQMKFEFVDCDGASGSLDLELLACIANQTQHFGKGLRIVPDARLDDGLLDLCFIEAAGSSRGELLATLQNVKTGAHSSNPRNSFKQVRECTIHLGGPGVFSMDGEPVKHDGTVRVQCLERRIPIFTDPKALGGDVV